MRYPKHKLESVQKKTKILYRPRSFFSDPRVCRLVLVRFFHKGSKETFSGKEFYELPGSGKTTGSIKSTSPTTRLCGDFKGKDRLKLRIYTDFRGS